MKDSRPLRRLAALAVGAGLALIACCFALGGKGGAAAYVSGAAGLVLLSGSLIVLQLSFWREGDRRRLGEASTAPAPWDSLPEPNRRGVGDAGEQTRRLLQWKLAQAEADDRQREKRRLGLREEEDILFMERRRGVWFWPVAALSALLLCASAGSGPHEVLGFSFLAAGLAGLLSLSAVKGRVKYYLTSFRVLVREEPLCRGPARWTALRYADVTACALAKGCSRRTVALRAGVREVEISGLPVARLESLVSLLRGKLQGGPAGTVKPVTPL